MSTDSFPLTRPSLIRLLAFISAGAIAIVFLWPSLVSKLFDSTSFLPHLTCYLRNPALVRMHWISDLAIGVSYVIISGLLTLLVHRARRDIPFSWVFLAFGMFIIACGATHLMEVVTIWKPLYWLSGAVKIVTAIASAATALILPPLIPKALAMIQAAKQSEERRVQLQERLGQLEEERAARAEAEEATRAKDAFLATLSHELRTPMTSILGWSSIVAQGNVDAETQNTAISAIERSARIQAQLIDDLLDVSRIVAGKLPLDLRHVDLSAVVRASVESNQLQAREKGVRLEAMLPPAPIVTLADGSRMHQVVSNLLTNAIKFTPAGGHTSIELSRSGEHAEIIVTDSGAGIDHSFLPHVFERFSQQDESSTRQHGGMGLGLAIVRHLVELHGGSVSASSGGPGQGATFKVRLPLSGSIKPDDTPARSAAGAEPQPQLSGVRLLLVEDDALARQMMQAIFRRAGAEVRVAASAAEAMVHFESRRPDVVVTDIAMPGEDGFSLLQRIRLHEGEDEPRVPVIAVSALVRSDDRERILMAGFDEYLQKPIRPERLVHAVAGVL
jgi:signal transduction histidine kinase/CheY-like chemotaxis protein